MITEEKHPYRMRNYRDHEKAPVTRGDPGLRALTGENQRLPGTAGVPAFSGRREIFEPSQTSGSYLRPATRSFMGISALSVILMCSGQTSVQHLVMLQ